MYVNVVCVCVCVCVVCVCVCLIDLLVGAPAILSLVLRNWSGREKLCKWNILLGVL